MCAHSGISLALSWRLEPFSCSYQAGVFRLQPIGGVGFFFSYLSILCETEVRQASRLDVGVPSASPEVSGGIRSNWDSLQNDFCSNLSFLLVLGEERGGVQFIGCSSSVHICLASPGFQRLSVDLAGSVPKSVPVSPLAVLSMSIGH